MTKEQDAEMREHIKGGCICEWSDRMLAEIDRLRAANIRLWNTQHRFRNAFDEITDVITGTLDDEEEPYGATR